MNRQQVTLATDTIHNPAEVRHFMRIKPAGKRVRVYRNGALIAETDAALRLLEVGKDIYDPVYYLPQSALKAPFAKAEKTTHCPLKGDASYLSLVDDAGQVVAPELAWTYDAPFDFADQLTGYVAFWSDRVTFEEAPL